MIVTVQPKNGEWGEITPGYRAASIFRFQGKSPTRPSKKLQHPSCWNNIRPFANSKHTVIPADSNFCLTQPTLRDLQSP